MKIYRGVEELKTSLGDELGPSGWLVVEQQRIEAFADATDDRQWIHVDPDRAAEGPFGGTIAHGYLSLSLLPRMVAELRTFEGARMGVNYGLNKVRFPSPVPSGSRIRARTTVIGVTEPGPGCVQLVNRVVVEIEGQEKPALVAEQVGRYYF